MIPKIPPPIPRKEMDMFKKVKEDIEDGKSLVRSAAIMSAMALVIAWITLVIVLEKSNA